MDEECALSGLAAGRVREESAVRVLAHMCVVGSQMGAGGVVSRKQWERVCIVRWVGYRQDGR